MWGANELRAAALRFERVLRLFHAATDAPAQGPDGQVDGVAAQQPAPATPAAPDPIAERQTKIDDLLRRAAGTDDHGRRSALIAEAVRLHMEGDGADEGVDR